MVRIHDVAKVIIGGGILFSCQAFGQTGEAATPARCHADLGRIKNEFCLNTSHVSFGSNPQTPLSYQWDINDQVFDLSAKSCMDSSSLSGDRQDFVIALDRSRSMWVVDGTNAKTGTVSIASAKLLIEAVKEEAQKQPEKAAKVGLMLFSTDESCDEYVNGSIVVDRVFPCLYIPAASSADADHIKRLFNLLAAAEGKYSQGGLDRGSDYSIIANAFKNNIFELDWTRRSGLVLMSDGRTYSGKQDDTFAYLRSGNYLAAQTSAVDLWNSAGMKNVKTVFALSTMDELFAGAIHKEVYQNMCALPDAASGDCASPVNQSNPDTWPVNKLDLEGFAVRLTASAGGGSERVIKLTTKEQITKALEILRYAEDDLLKIDAVSWVDSNSIKKSGALVDGKVLVQGIPYEAERKMILTLHSGSREVEVPILIKLNLKEATNSTLESAEMQCSGLDATPKLSLKNLQGGSASCAVVGSGSTNSYSLAIVMFAPLIALLAFLGKGLRVTLTLVSLVFVFVGSNRSLAADGGLNVLQYRPVVNGDGAADSAHPEVKGSYNLGMFVDYANDALELGVQKNQRSSSVVDDLVTTHIAANAGIARNFAVGAHLPIIANSKVDRQTEDELRKRTLFSDASVYGKYKFFSDATYDLGLMPLVTLPTGNPDTLTGDGSSNYGALFLVSGRSQPFTWSANIGYLQREQALEIEDSRARPITVRGQFVSIFGSTWKFARSYSLAGSFQFKATAGEKVDFTNSNPSEWSVTGKYQLKQYLFSSSVGTGIGKGYGSPDYRLVFGVSWLPTTGRVLAGN